MRQSSSPDVGMQILRSLRRILRRVNRYSRQVGRETGLAIPSLLCLRAIRDASEPEVTVAYLAEAVQLSRSTTSTLVDKLVRAGLVTRERNTRDRRRVQLGLTALGHARLEGLPMPLEDRFLERLSALSDTQRAQIVTSLELVVRLMDAEDLDASPLLVDGTSLSGEL